ncbi:hypothetical protein BU16DRAFT_618292 [Lophium mytilinum]|uniref:Peptidase C14 caspase domain-containing protein n=1 Tax=Lophium mytilinum TaxID=390894 RepID=A0A6A6QTP6_9PEZI|nr:hypothetical protein BU16DRAFT_618292 [Lophium mytilinum]
MTNALKSKINVGLKEQFDRNPKNDYDSIQVLLLYWEESDEPGFLTEALRLKKLFEELLKFRVHQFAIPTRDSHLALDAAIAQFLTRLESPPKRSLAIVHYGGHGDQDFLASKDRRRRAVWAAQSEDGPTLDWYEIQPKLVHARGDVLLLLDCCYAAQAARGASDRTVPPNVELQASCAMGCQAASPGQDSFTTAWIKEVEDSLKAKGHARIADIHHQLARADRCLLQTPLYFPLGGRRETIRLEPLISISAETPRLNSEEAALTLRMTVRSPLSGELLDEIIYWLKTYAPREISGLMVTDVVSRAECLRDFVLEHPPQVQSLAQLRKMPNPSKKEIRSAWDIFNVRLGNALKLLATSFSSYGNHQNSATVDEIKVHRFLRSFETSILALQDTIERNVMALPELHQKDCLTKAISDPEMRILGIVESLKVRLMANFPVESDNLLERASYTPDPQADTPLTVSLFTEQHPTHGTVLVEYKHLDDSDKNLDDLSQGRLKRLADVLQAPQSDGFRTPKCLGYFSAEDQGRHGLIFINPVGNEYVPVSLQTILWNHSQRASSTRSRHQRPTLGERFNIARKIGQALLKWHGVGWVHQGIASYNIVFFRHKNRYRIDYSEPYLCGFDFTRESDESSTKRYEKDVVNDIYRHPDRQGRYPPKRHSKIHDYYSFGLLLLEIGLWDLLPSMFGRFVKQKGLLALRHEILNKSKGLLSHDMGLAYEDAAVTCLTGDFGVEKDDKIECELGRAFHGRVLQSFDAGLDLDGASFFDVEG